MQYAGCCIEVRIESRLSEALKSTVNPNSIPISSDSVKSNTEAQGWCDSQSGGFARAMASVESVQNTRGPPKLHKEFTETHRPIGYLRGTQVFNSSRQWSDNRLLATPAHGFSPEVVAMSSSTRACAQVNRTACVAKSPKPRGGNRVDEGERVPFK